MLTSRRWIREDPLGCVVRKYGGQVGAFGVEVPGIGVGERNVGGIAVVYAICGGCACHGMYSFKPSPLVFTHLRGRILSCGLARACSRALGI